MFNHLDLITTVLYVAFFAMSKVAVSPTSSRHLRGPDVELEDLLAVFVGEEEGERHLSSATTSTALPEGSTVVYVTAAPTPTPIPAECSKPCKDDEVCAREYYYSRAKCHTKCSAFPSEETCVGNRKCVSTWFDCEGYANVFDLFCECHQSEGEGSYSCLHSECGLW